MTKPTYSWDFPRVKKMKTTPEKSDFKRRGSQSLADVGRPGVNLDRTLKTIRERIYKLKKKMALLGRQLRYDDEIRTKVIDEYMEVNNQLKAAKIYEAEFCHTRNEMR